MKYIVSLALNGRIDVEIDAPSFEAAEQEALTEFMCMSQEELYSRVDIFEYYAVNAEREDGAFRDY